MAKPRHSTYEITPFIKRILELQAKHGYTDRYVIDNVLDKNGKPFTEDLQTYGKWKTGERKPQRWHEAIVSFAEFYGVSTDYLLKPNEPETPQIGSVQQVTGLSVDAVRNILDIKTKYPDIMKMLDVLLSNTNGENIVYLIDFYNQIINDFNDNQNNVADSSYDLVKMQSRLLHTQQAYNYISTLVHTSMREELESNALKKKNEQLYTHSQEYYESIPEQEDNDYDLDFSDGEKRHLRSDRW